jgi:hypothetical protein
MFPVVEQILKISCIAIDLEKQPLNNGRLNTTDIVNVYVKLNCLGRKLFAH